MLRRTLFRFAEPTAEATTGVAAPKKKFNGHWGRNTLPVVRKHSYKPYQQWKTGYDGPYYGVPMQSQGMLVCCDNTHAKQCRLLKYAHERFSHCRCMPVAIHRAKAHKFSMKKSKIKAGQIAVGSVHWALLWTRRGSSTRKSGIVLNQMVNSCILIDDKFQPRGTRVTMVPGRHIDNRAHLKAAVMAVAFF